MTDAAEGLVVLRFKDGHALRCSLICDFSPTEPKVTVALPDGARDEVAIEELKAVFFLKEPRRHQAELEMGRVADSRAPGALARVEFGDGEIIHGRVQQYSVADHGFYLYPTAMESNNERIFVVASAIAFVTLDS